MSADTFEWNKLNGFTRSLKERLSETPDDGVSVGEYLDDIRTAVILLMDAVETMKK